MSNKPPPNIAIPPHCENPDDEVARVKIAISAVFSHTPPQPPPNATEIEILLSRRVPADAYLTSFQRCPIAWIVCDRLLIESGEDSSGTSAAAQAETASRRFFAAQTLMFKCREDTFIRQIPPSVMPSLRDSLVTQASNYFLLGGNRPLVTRLCMAIAALAVQMNWTTAIPDILETVYGPNPKLVPMVLDLFSILPEECSSDRLFVSKTSKKEVMLAALSENVDSVVSFLTHTFAKDDRVGRLEVMRCMSSWLKYVDIPIDVLTKSIMLEMPFRTIAENSSDDLFDVAVDCICEMLCTYGTGPRANSILIGRLVPAVMALGADPFKQAKEMQDQDLLRGYCRIFSEMGENYMDLIMSKEDLEQNKLVELVLHCTEIPDMEIATLTLNFWYSFTSALESQTPFDFRQRRIEYYTPLLTRLLQVCTVLLRYPTDILSLPPDAFDDVVRDRFYVTETIQDLCHLLGGDIVLTCLAGRLQEEYALFENTPDNEKEESWQGCESCLLAINSVSKYIPNDESTYLPGIMSLLSHRTLPQDSHLLRNTISMTIGSFGPWLGLHPNYLETLMNYIAEGLAISECASAAAIAVRELCEGCYKQQMGDPVLNLYDNIVKSNLNDTSNFQTDQKDENEVLEGVCKAVSSQFEFNPRMASTCFERLAQPIGNRLAKLVAPESTGSSKGVVAEIERLTVIVRFLNLPSVDPAQPGDALIFELMKQSWSLLDATAFKYPEDPNLAEKLCRLHKHALRKVGADLYAPLLEPLMIQIVRNFDISYQSPYLYLASICITEYGRKLEYVPKLFVMVSQLSTSCFSLLKSIEDFTNHPDVVEEFFYLVGRFMYYCPEPLVLSPLLLSLIQCASVGMHIQHKDANKGTLNFLEHTLTYGIDIVSSCREASLQSVPEGGDKDEADAVLKAKQHLLLCQQSLQTAILAEGQNIVSNIGRALIGELPAYTLDNRSGSITGIIWKLNVLCPELLLNWLAQPLEWAPDSPVKTEFINCLRERRGRDELTLATKAFNKYYERMRSLVTASRGGSLHMY
eukprot:CAMPEP_0172487086 /NCGR_PEP_ID=MMETSP1066-20121228/15974_1 /TAXON_ID=671091 /ORGANISM="Coscinodiscus wailesii, Strain CCMP2513" /LENGTH=1031 /DNA_ID=CAMNT_0013253477 /DNA_START=327 /DNA_END=3422 /DNA_ORIENTATION=-